MTLAIPYRRITLSKVVAPRWIFTGGRTDWPTGTTTAATGNVYDVLKIAFWNGRTALTKLRLGFVGGYLGSSAGGEVASASDIRVWCSITTSAGVTTSFTFSGSAYGDVVAGAVLETDDLTLDIAAGEKFWISTCRYVASGVVCPSSYSSYNTGRSGEGGAGGSEANQANAIAMVTGGTAPTSDARTGYGPAYIVGLPRSRAESVAIVGDSIAYGSNEDSRSGGDSKGHRGYLRRGLSAKSMHFAGFARSGATIASAVGSEFSLRRQVIQKYATHVIFELGENNVSSGFATMSAAYGAALDEIAATINRPVIGTQLLVKATSTDAYATVANQTASGATVRGQMRSYVSGLVGTKLKAVIDAKVLVADTVSTDVWRADGIVQGQASNAATTDGLHPSTWVHDLAKAAVTGAVDAGVFAV